MDKKGLGVARVHVASARALPFLASLPSDYRRMQCLLFG